MLSMKQDGAALVVGLVLLVIVTVLAISGMNTATTGLAIARNDQNSEYAFQAAEAGLEIALSQGFYPTTGLDLGEQVVNAHDTVDVQIAFATIGPPPDGDSFGSTVAYHFVATATAQSRRVPGEDTDRDASAVHTQGFYIKGPADDSSL